MEPTSEYYVNIMENVGYFEYYGIVKINIAIYNFYFLISAFG